MNVIIADIRKELSRYADPVVRDGARRYFKEQINVYGIKTAVVRDIASRYFKAIIGEGKDRIFILCDELLKSGYMEEAFIAFQWADSLRKAYTPGDFKLFERWVYTYVSNWAECDTLCNHAVGSLVEKFPALVGNLKKWAKSGNRWVKRAAAVTLILPARRGMFLGHALEICDILLVDPDDMVQKGYGWLLKESGRKHQAKVFAYVVKHKHIMPRTALRYAVELMPADLKTQAMAR